jgi:hypothetical protein
MAFQKRLSAARKAVVGIPIATSKFSDALEEDEHSPNRGVYQFLNRNGPRKIRKEETDSGSTKHHELAPVIVGGNQLHLFCGYHTAHLMKPKFTNRSLLAKRLNKRTAGTQGQQE